jgi:TP901 family phage tail tape measure protein
MAETLAQAILEIKYDDSDVVGGMRRTQREAAATGNEISRRFTASGQEILRAANGLEYFIDALGRARRENGQFVTATERLAAGIGGPGGFGGLGGASGIRGLELGFGNLAGAALKTAGAIGLFTSAWEVANFTIQQNVALDNAAAAVETLGVNSADLEGKLRILSTELDNNISTVDLLKASYDVASSGFANAADATEVLKAAALGATGGFSDINTVADATTSVLNAYGLAASNATKLVDGFIQTQNDGKIIIGQYAQEIGRVAPVAAAAGVSIQELNAAVSVATAQGVPVGSTFAGLRQAISSILKPTSEATELAGTLGLAFNAQALKAKGLGQFLKDIEEKTGGAADALTKLFGPVEAVAAIQPLLNDGLVKFNNNLDSQTSKSGQAADAAEKASKTLSGSVKRLQNALSNLTTQANDGLVPVADSINVVADALNKLPGSIKLFKSDMDALNKIIEDMLGGLVRVSKFDLGGLFGPKPDADRPAIGPVLDQKIIDRIKQEDKKNAQARKDAAFAFQNAERDIVRPAREQLEIAQRLSGLDGERLRQARQRLDIEKLLKEERKRRQEFQSLDGLEGVAKGDVAAIDAAAKLEAAGINVRTEIVKGSDELRQAGKKIGDEIKDASKTLIAAERGFANAVSADARLASPEAQQRAIDTYLQRIQKNLDSGLINRRELARFGAGTFDYGSGIAVDLTKLNLQQLQRIDAATSPIVDTNVAVNEAAKSLKDLTAVQKSIGEAQKGLEEAVKELNASIQASNGRESNLNITVPVGGQKQVYLP